MAELTEIAKDAGFSIPQVSVTNVTSWILIFLGIVFGAILITFLVYLFIVRLRFNKRFIIFGMVNNAVTLKYQDKAMFERIGVAGDYWARTRKLKKIVARPKLEMSKNTYWYFEREDGELINFVLEDINERQKEAKAYFVDEDMRLQRLGIQRNLNDRYNKLSFWKKYEHIIMSAIFILIITIALVVILDRISDILKAIVPLVDALNNVANNLGQILKAYTSGLSPA